MSPTSTNPSTRPQAGGANSREDDGRPIIGLGTIVVDHQLFLAALPEPDSKAEVLEDRHQIGGPVPTALSLLRRFGLPANFIGQWATDAFGVMIEEDLQREEITFARPRPDSSLRTGFAHVWVERSTGRRSIAAYRGSQPVLTEDLPFALLSQCRALHLDGWSGEAAVAAARAVKASGGTVFLDLGSPKPQLESLLPHVDVLSCPSRVVHQLCSTDDLRAGADRLLDLGPREVIVTSGHQGALLRTRESSCSQPAFPVQAVDTCGAGDIFNGAIIYATLLGHPHADRLRFACAAAALKCTRVGNRDALPTLDQIEALLAASPGG